jgi:hypothetical protein
MRRRSGAACVFAAWVAWTLPGTSQTSPHRASASSFVVAHEEAMRRAQVWAEPATPIDKARPGENPGGAHRFGRDEAVRCQFRPGGIAGNTPKFDCQLESGEKVKVKYGRSNPEVYTEVAATRLLGVLGFPTDRMYVVQRVRCFGCPEDPFEDLQCMNEEGASLERCFPHVDYTHAQDFESAVIERPVKGRRIETSKERGWAWEELKKIDPSAGGATRAQVDALRLLAVFLGHWDNKAKNQRLICLGEPDTSTSCERPLAMVQDLGATFGPDKLNLENWATMPIWADAATCQVSMKTLPYGGSTFPDAYISEEGRQFLATRLSRLSLRQIRDLFEGARVARYPHKGPDGKDVENWVRAFEDKVHSIVERAPCPPAP